MYSDSDIVWSDIKGYERCGKVEKQPVVSLPMPAIRRAAIRNDVSSKD